MTLTRVLLSKGLTEARVNKENIQRGEVGCQGPVSRVPGRRRGHVRPARHTLVSGSQLYVRSFEIQVEGNFNGGHEACWRGVHPPGRAESGRERER